MIKFLIQQGVPINKCDQDGYTPLTCAIEDGKIEIVKFLVANGADIDFIDPYSWTPLIVAIQGNHLEIAMYLIQQGANVNLGDNLGWTPLTCAIGENGNLEAVRLLVENGADIHIHDGRTGWLPMSYAIDIDAPEIVRYLMCNGANMNYQDKYGKKAIEVTLHDYIADIDMFKMLVM